MTIICNDIHTALYLPDEANLFHNSQVGEILTSSFFFLLYYVHENYGMFLLSGDNIYISVCI